MPLFRRITSAAGALILAVSLALSGAPPPASAADSPLPAADPGFCLANADAYYSLRTENANSTGNAIIDRFTVTGGGTGLSSTVTEVGSFGQNITTGRPANTSTWESQTANVNTNSLGVAANGYAYLTVQYDVQERTRLTSIGSWRAWETKDRYIDIWRVDLSAPGSSPTRLVQHRTIATPTNYISGGAVDPAGNFYFSAYEVMGTGAGQYFRVHLYRLNADGTTPKVAIADSAPGTFPGRASGDFAFDGQGNLMFTIASETRGRSGTITAAALASANPTVPITGFALSDEVTFPSNGEDTQPAGVAYVRGGNVVWQGKSWHTLRDPVSLQTSAARNFTSQPNQRDLGSCTLPTTFQLNKAIDGRAFPGDQFTLSATVRSVTATATTTGSTTGLQPQHVGPIAVTPGTTVTFGEAPAPGTQTNLANYTSRYECRNMATGGAGTVLPVTGTGPNRAVTVPVGENARVVCTITNRDAVPRLAVAKTASPASGAKLVDGQAVDYTLSFDNRTGTKAAPIAHVDHLADVLDDAVFQAGSLSTRNVPATGSPVSPAIGLTVAGLDGSGAVTGTTLEFGGEVPARSLTEVSFRVRVKPNEADALERQTGAPVTPGAAPRTGYRLVNHLLPAGAAIPGACEPGQMPCTVHSIPAWTISKESQPGDGATLHSGGNVYYRVTVTNLSGDDFSGITVVDDLTETLFASTWSPAAPPLVPVPHGISFYDADGALISQLPASAVPPPTFSGSDTYDPTTPTTPFPEGRWTLTTQPFTLPAAARTAVIGYVVTVGTVAAPNDPAQTYRSGDADVLAAPNASWINTARASAATVTIDGQDRNLEPNRCRLSESGDGPAAPADCTTAHALGDGYFHIQKNSAATDPSGDVDWNIPGARFLLADTAADAEDGVWSRWLCRASNGAPTFDPPGAGTGALQIGPDSAAHADIVAWNTAHPLNTRPLCGLFYEHTAGADADGQPPGTWHAQDLPGGRADLADWRSDGQGTYWLAETAAPQGHQLLSAPMKFWVAPASATPAGLTPGVDPEIYDHQGRLSLPVTGEGEAAAPGQGHGSPVEIRHSCTRPQSVPDHQQPACIMPTGWLMQVYDVRLPPLPAAGGPADGGVLAVAGAALFILALLIAWRRRAPRTINTDSHTPPHSTWRRT